MKQYFDVEETRFGFTLKSGSIVYVLNRSKIYNNSYQFYLKQVEPNNEFISGLFLKKKNMYQGRTVDNQRVIVRMMIGTALLVIE